MQPERLALLWLGVDLALVRARVLRPRLRHHQGPVGLAPGGVCRRGVRGGARGGGGGGGVGGLRGRVSYETRKKVASSPSELKSMTGAKVYFGLVSAWSFFGVAQLLFL